MVEFDDRVMAFPFDLGSDRGLKTLPLAEGLRLLIEQLLFTAPGERVMRPSFGVGVQNAVFEPNAPFLASRIRLALEQNAFEHLGRQVRVHKLEVEPDDVTLHLRFTYELLGSLKPLEEAAFSIPLRSPA